MYLDGRIHNPAEKIEWRNELDADGWHCTVADFLDAINSGMITNDDGIGLYSSATRVSNVTAVPSAMKNGNIDKRFTHVTWFNK